MNNINEAAQYDSTHKKPVYILLMNGKTLLANIITKATGDEYSHSCISFNSNLSPLYSFGTNKDGKGGFAVADSPTDKKIFKNDNIPYSVYVMYVSDSTYRKMKDKIKWFESKADQMTYDFIGLLDIFRNKTSDDHTNAYFCSRFVAEILSFGTNLTRSASLYRPSQLADLDNISLVNKGNNLHAYNNKITLKNEKLIKLGKYTANSILAESMASNIEADAEADTTTKLSFTKIRLSDAVIRVYSSRQPKLSHIRINKNTSGYIWIDDDTEVVAVVNVEEKDDDYKWIQAFEIFGKYKGTGLSKLILDVAIKELKATNLSVNKTNELAISIYKKRGFVEYKSTDHMIFMSLDKNISIDDDIDESTKFYKNPAQQIKRKTTIMKNKAIKTGNQTELPTSPVPDEKEKASDIVKEQLSRLYPNAQITDIDTIIHGTDNIAIIHIDSDYDKVIDAIYDSCKARFDHTTTDYTLEKDDKLHCLYISPKV